MYSSATSTTTEYDCVSTTDVRQMPRCHFRAEGATQWFTVDSADFKENNDAFPAQLQEEIDKEKSKSTFRYPSFNTENFAKWIVEVYPDKESVKTGTLMPYEEPFPANFYVVIYNVVENDACEERPRYPIMSSDPPVSIAMASRIRSKVFKVLSHKPPAVITSCVFVVLLALLVYLGLQVFTLSTKVQELEEQVNRPFLNLNFNPDSIMQTFEWMKVSVSQSWARINMTETVSAISASLPSLEFEFPAPAGQIAEVEAAPMVEMAMEQVAN